MLRRFFERFLVSRWPGPSLQIRYWDGRELTVGGGPPAALILHIKTPAVLWGILRHPSLGFGHAYVDGRLAVDGDLQEFLRAAVPMGSRGDSTPLLALYRALRLLPTATPPSQAEANARFHYDRGNEFFGLWLDPSLTYSCAYFRTEQDDLATAQEQKRELLCRKLDLQPGMTLLDVGCGWGSLLFHAIERYGVRGIGINPSREQARYVEEEARRRGLAGELTLHVADWRAIGGAYDRVVSVGMYEHVGRAHGREFHRKWSTWLKPGGVSVLHTIGAMNSIPVDSWISENIFPGGYLPSLTELAAHASRAGLIIADVENLWRHYALTLAAWRRNFAAQRGEILQLFAPETKAEEISIYRNLLRRPRGAAAPADAPATAERFYRTWWLYLNASEAAFRTGRILLWQLVLTKGKRSVQPLTRQGWDVRESAA